MRAICSLLTSALSDPPIAAEGSCWFAKRQAFLWFAKRQSLHERIRHATAPRSTLIDHLYHSQRKLDVLVILDDLERGLADRRPALNQYAAKPGADANSIVRDLLHELASVRASSSAPPLLGPAGPGAAAAAAVGPLSDMAFDDATNKSAAFMRLSSNLAATNITSTQGQIDAIAIGFDGQ